MFALAYAPLRRSVQLLREPRSRCPTASAWPICCACGVLRGLTTTYRTPVTVAGRPCLRYRASVRSNLQYCADQYASHAVVDCAAGAVVVQSSGHDVACSTYSNLTRACRPVADLLSHIRGSRVLGYSRGWHVASRPATWSILCCLFASTLTKVVWVA